MDVLLAEAKAEGEGTLERCLGPFQLTALGGWRGDRRRHLCLSGLVPHYAGPGLMLSFVLSGLGCALRGSATRICGDDPLAGSAYTYAYATLVS